MNAEEVKIQIKDMIQNIQDSLDLEYLNGEQVKELYKKQKLALEIALNYIDNSISKEVIEKKIEELNEMYKDTNDIKIKQSIWWRKKALQDLLEEK